MGRGNFVIVLQPRIHLSSAHRLGQHDNVAVIKLGHYEILPALAFDRHQIARRRPEGFDHFSPHGFWEFLEPIYVAVHREQQHALAFSQPVQVARPSRTHVAALVEHLVQQCLLVRWCVGDGIAVSPHGG